VDSRHNRNATAAPDRLRREIRDLLLPELEQVATDAGEPAFRSRQLAQWLYTRRVESFDAMTNLPAAFRKYLN
jgi:23S rRNA (adenine2503-C2)-methyltransferase